MPLGDDLYLLAHSSEGKPYIHMPSLSVGLATAVLIDLMLAGRIGVSEGKVIGYERRPTGLAVADSALGAIFSVANHPPNYWLRAVASDSHDRISGALTAAGLLRKVQTRRLGLVPVTRIQPVDPELAVRVRARLRYALRGQDEVPVADAALCAVVGILGLESRVFLDGLPAGHLAAVSAALHPMLRAILSAAEHEIAQAAMSAYR
ncbi:GPP34 family phosphoprotein [Longispora sp. NPDC051575]|uniref:GOLPH3/VPS74 family protein n=1 Tax=Longispora sp. NPDC051575 TaxID=3154943 RepID=UPI003435A9BF